MKINELAVSVAVATGATVLFVQAVLGAYFQYRQPSDVPLHSWEWELRHIGPSGLPSWMDMGDGTS